MQQCVETIETDGVWTVTRRDGVAQSLLVAGLMSPPPWSSVDRITGVCLPWYAFRTSMQTESERIIR